jgi:TIR domain-containing protein/SIR2-like protein
LVDSIGEDKRIFISYSHEDDQAARRFYLELKQRGLEPWLDKESLLPGQVWRDEISKAIKSSRYFIGILSSNSVERRGYVQKELKEALDILEEISYTKIFVIPVRLDDCKVSDRKVNVLHIVDMFPDWRQGFEKVLRAMGVENISNFNWTNLLFSIRDGKCTPIIGPEACNPWIPSATVTANRWAQEYDYPLPDSDQLPRVAQFLAIKEGDGAFPKDILSREIKRVQIPNFYLAEHRNKPPAVLADLNLPIYITTNYDHFIEEALKAKGKQPISDFCRWNEDLVEYANENEINVKLYDKDGDYKATSGNPLVYHLYGDIDHPRSMVLTEKDYIDFVIFLNRSNVKTMFPTIVRLALASNSILSIGYTLDDMSFRTIFRSIVNSLHIKFQISNIVVMEHSQLINNNKVTQAEKYIEDYTKDMLKMQPFWAEPITFSQELRHQLDSFSAG